MSSNYFGEPNMGGGGGGGGGSSGRKSKKSGNSEKPKQPQRGLGVAQLEKIRLHGQLGCNYQYPSPSLHSPNYPPNFNQEDVMRVQTGYSSIPSSSSFSYATSSSSAASSASYGFQPSIMMGGVGDYERAPVRYGDSQPNSTPSWNRGTGIYEHQHFTQPSMSANRPLLNLQAIEPKKSKKHRNDSIGSSQNSDSSDTQELDLELRLSL
ncbi:protein SPEAR3-like isoform X2 [Tripterygium wilfordii]|uniref:protein SPEAR3-like isoform X2 n=1 Tax=Tripterygium wilfordii TaxID=458696 RepID=UPI0018F829B1|nr:protein SPEAR3-like isoform X2 [Tripterygium wilfordii]